MPLVEASSFDRSIHKFKSEYFVEDGDQIDPEEENTKLGPFELLQVLGQGKSGTVRLAQHSETKLKSAIKVINRKQRMSDENWRNLNREIAVLKLIEHPRIVQLYDVVETSSNVYMIMEYVSGGELFDYVIEKGELTEEESLGFLAQIVMALQHCHNYNICHRDLKPENILLDEKRENIKVADFGMARMTFQSEDGKVRTSCGSPQYASPEVIKGISYDPKVSDVWSLGVILYVMISGTMPFYNDHLPSLLKTIIRGEYEMPANISPKIKRLIKRMLTVDPEKRIALSEIRYHLAYANTDYFAAESRLPQETKEIDLNNLDDSILFDMHSLGFGTLEDILRELPLDTNDSVFYKGLYRSLLSRKEKRVQSLETLSPRSRTRRLLPEKKRSKSFIMHMTDSFDKLRHKPSH